ncbi:hypothetical protein HGA89_06370, partial [bacterium]|nr:hypothetical protein [bacterium]
MRFREVVLVIVLVLAGLEVYQVKSGHWNLDLNLGDEFVGFGREFSAEETRTIDGPLPPVIEIQIGQGWVDVRGGDQETVQMTFKKVVWRRSEEEARDVAGRIRYTLTAAADKLT